MLRVPYALSVYDDHEIKAVVKVLKEHRTNMGKDTEEFERKISKIYGKKYGIMVNSGSSANLLAVEILNLPPSSEVVTPVLTFSTTISPLLQHGLVPVFADVIPGKYIIDVDKIEKLITPKTKAILVPLLLGNIPQMDRIRAIAKKYKLFFIEDSCDTIGATYKGRPTGFYSDITTTSFFGSHIITAGGNGGMILVNNKEWRDKAKVLRGWGRSSSIFSESESIEKRFKKKLNNLDYDAKFIFEEVGYNFLPNELGAAFGLEQLKKLPTFVQLRKNNFKRLLKYFTKYETYFKLPEELANTSTAWLAFPLTIKKTAPFKRIEIVKYLEKENIQTRPIFTGNILKQPGFKNLKGTGKYPVADDIMENGFIIGCHNGLTKTHLNKIEEVFTKFIEKRCS